ncbi:hypothetical protein [Mucilaginibacter pedocola]|uniref:hypothetical protein n=1 Tax=Mucilaginibacter pedocola TaxID=1792845 RepID=UPI0013906075|nr:hypothetical protein [Mucilaginibacter pedocola]
MKKSVLSGGPVFKAPSLLSTTNSSIELAMSKLFIPNPSALFSKVMWALTVALISDIRGGLAIGTK